MGKRNGFTLIETMIVMGILSVVMGIIFVVVTASAQSMNTANAQAAVQQNVRDVMQALFLDLLAAGKENIPSANPPVQGVRIVQNPVPGSPWEIVFQTPVDDRAEGWTQPIRLRYVNEDANGNARLDPGEDLNENGVLDRHIIRIPGGVGAVPTIVGNVNSISNATAQIVDGAVLITIESTQLFDPRQEHFAHARLDTVIYPMN